MSADSATQVSIIETKGLGDRGYIVHDGQSALVVDPPRDFDRVEEIVDELGITITHVGETHLHNDYVTGGYQLAKKHQAQYLVPAGVDVAFGDEAFVQAVGGGSQLHVGGLRVDVVHTPGHTPHHISFAVAGADGPGAVFTGGSLLYGTVGRPDLISPELTVQQAHDQWHSARRLVAELPASTQIFPTHGFGSFCSSIQTDGRQTSLGEECNINPALTQTESDFVTMLLSGLDVFPSYYAHMGPANAAGPDNIDVTLPRPTSPAELRERTGRGEWVVDLRARSAFDAEHVPGSVSFDARGPFINYLGWMIPWGTPVTLLAETSEQVESAQRELYRIGLDRPVGHAVGDVKTWLGADQSASGIRRVDFPAMAREWRDNPDAVVIDTRQILEWEGGHVDKAHFIPFYEVLDRMDEVPTDRPVYVYCGSGYRAAVVVSLLHRAGLTNVVHVDDNFSNAAAAGLTMHDGGATPREPGWTWTASRAAVRWFDPDASSVSHVSVN